MNWHYTATIILALAATGYCATTDLKSGKIPNRVTIPVFLLAVALAFAAGGLRGTLVSLVGAGLAGFVPIILFKTGAMGGGDVKLFAALGALFGPSLVLEVQFAAFVMGAVYGIFLWYKRGLLLKGFLSIVAIGIGPFGGKMRKSPKILEARKLTILFGPCIFLSTLLFVTMGFIF